MTEATKAMLPKFNTPFYAIHGGADHLTLPSGSQYLYDNTLTDTKYKQITIFPGLKHECIHEVLPHRTEVINKIVQYFNDQVSGEKSV